MSAPPRLPAEFDPDWLTVIIDTREQLPWGLPYRTVTDTVPLGDYTVRGFETDFALERKGPADLISCVTSERERFEKELVRLRGYACKAVIVEAPWSAFESGNYRSRVAPEAITSSILGWQLLGVPFVLCDNRQQAARFAAKMIHLFARRRWRQLRALTTCTEAE